MPVPPSPKKYVCHKCGFVKIHKPKSDMISATDMCHHCPKCGEFMLSMGQAGQLDLLLHPLQNLNIIFKSGKR